MLRRRQDSGACIFGNVLRGLEMTVSVSTTLASILK